MAKRSNARWSWTGNALLLTAMAASAQAQAATTPGTGRIDVAAARIGAPVRLYLEVVLNQMPQPQLVPFEAREGRLHADAVTLRGLGFRLPGAGDHDTVALDAIPGTRVRYDAARQRVEIDAPLSQLALGTTALGTHGGHAPVAAQSAPGVLLNYDLYASDTGTASSLTAASELRVFGLGHGVLSNTAVARGIRGDRDGDGRGWRGDSVRLDTRWDLSFPGPAVTLTVGDAFTGFLDWTRPVRIGGIQLGRNYALQPYRVTAPLPGFLGEASVPSDIELYIDGIRQYSGSAPAGPFQVNAVPGITGAGLARVVVTDAYGRVRTLEFPFYSTQRLLARGLSDWSVSLGAVREDYGIRSFSYAGDPVASGSFRYGASDHFTLETHAETSAGLVHAGVGGAWLLGMAGVLGASHARSAHDGARGSQSALGYGWNNHRYNLSLDSRRTRGDYRDIASLHGPRPPTRNERVVAGITTGAAGNVSLSYLRLDHADPDIDRARYAGLSWSRSFAGRWSAHFTYNRNLDDADDRSLHLGVLVPLGDTRQLGASWQRDRDRDTAMLDLARPIPGDGGFGWRVQGRAGDRDDGGLVEAGWLGDHARVGAGVMRFGDSRHTYAQASGSLVRMGGHTFAARNVHDAFAVVSTDGHAGVPVKLENRVVGHTDARGMLLVTPLNAWQRNKLSIDPMDLPADVRVAEVDQLATPRDRAGARVRFQVTPVRAAVLVLHDEHGQPLPVGSRVRTADGREAVVGYEGEAYLEGLQAHNHIHVRHTGRGCVIAFDYPETAAAALPRIGPLRCLGPLP
ncbi:fimbrial biogenesis outer membrane usher protein [Luteimonas aestuarii]|uniref:Fimbrial biogenesis outer membrane usher protein n=1 Tax=Luteimonas aestuarii TaxID=453837 RepID=A0A4R5TY14_9GAMM|nr:fimbria/pilus outer membrane usher protein [Luteimonas aestuarii]TDK26080.1 fimbrial biogenesis outer membrane usher protein [Luteimonas aestuarii]